MIPRAPPLAPTSVFVTSVAADSTQLYVKWAQPTSSEGAVITKYKVDAVLVAGSVLTSSTDVLATARSHNITGLTAGAIYEIRLYAYNDQGYGAYQSATPICDTHIELCTALVVPRALPGDARAEGLRISVACNAVVLIMGARNVFSPGTVLPIPGDDKFVAHFGGSAATLFLMQLRSERASCRERV